MFKELDLDHPVKRLRLKAGLTQQQLADRIEGLSEQYLRRVEHGLVGQNTDLTHIFSYLFFLLEKRHEEEDREDFLTVIARLMSDYIVTAGDMNAPEIHSDDNAVLRSFTGGQWHASMATNLSLLVDDYYFIKRLWVKRNFRGLRSDKNYRTFRQFRQDFMRALGWDGPLSLYSFCSVLGLHVFTIQRFEQLHGEAHAPFDGANAGSWPADLRRALHEAGFEWNAIKFSGRGYAGTK